MLEFNFYRLKTLRKEKHLSQKELGKLLGCSSSNIGRWERGEVAPTTEYLTKFIATVGGNNISKFFYERIGNNVNY